MKWLIVLIVTIIVVSAPFIGGNALSWRAVLHDASSVDAQIFFSLRLPRVCGAFVIGVALSVAGAALQATFRNALATPFTLGTASASACGVALSMMLGFKWLPPIIAALFGALLASGVLLATTLRVRRVTPSELLLLGVAQSFFFTSIGMIAQTIAQPGDVAKYTRWLTGSIDTLDWPVLVPLSIVVFLVVGTLTVCGKAFDLIRLGNEFAQSHGLVVRGFLIALITSVSILSSIAILIGGPLAFAGILEPFVMRWIFGNRHRIVFPMSALVGGGMLVLADTIGRTALFPLEIPVSLVLGIVVVPCFVWIVITGRASV